MFQCAQNGLRLAADFSQHVPELAKLSLDGAQHLPDLAAALLQRQGAETHLQGIEHHQQGGGACQRNAEFALHPFHQAGPAQDFGIQPLGRQEQDGKVGRMRRRKVALTDSPGLLADACLQLAGGLLGCGRIGTLLGGEQPLIVFIGKLGVNRQPHGSAVLSLARQADGKIHHMPAGRVHLHLRGILIGCEHLLQQGAQLGFTKYTAYLHVGQQVFEIAYALGKGLHFTQTAMHHFKPFGHLLETSVQARLQGGLEFFIDCLPHFIELGAVALLQLRQLLL